MNGQISMFKKPIVWHMSLTAIYTTCPYCKAENSNDKYTGLCEECGQQADMDHEVVKMSPDYKWCEDHGLHGPVRKNAKGEWEEVKL